MVTDEVFSVVAETTRREIMAALRGGDKSVGQLVEELGASQPTVSKHLRVLREATLVTMRAEGQKRFYSLNTAPLAGVVEWLVEIGAPGTAVATGPASDGKAARQAPAAAGEHTATRPAARPAVESLGAVPSPGQAAASRLEARPGGHVPAWAPTPIQDTKPIERSMVPAANRGTEAEGSMPAQIGRSVGRAANKAADLLANLPKPKFGRRKE
ncbi:ArsR/SmtB family transcription factor [Pseudarthrobacter sp. P1]|uniref:ArsR/SmtB family transcription factor n=1 Tax=Pseudarthrobacter sp. P1 TaxID=3418418 RepID=UPI003CF412FA